METFYLDCGNRLSYNVCRDVLVGINQGFLWGFHGIIATKLNPDQLHSLFRWVDSPEFDILTSDQAEDPSLYLNKDVVFMMKIQKKRDRGEML